MGSRVYNVGQVWDSVRESLRERGIDLDALCGSELGFGAICVVPDLGESVREMAGSPRDQVVMVRVDDDSSRALDAWVESGAVKSRSEAAALFIGEGLRMHAGKLDELEQALRDVEEAKDRLKQRVRDVLDEDEEREAKE